MTLRPPAWGPLATWSRAYSCRREAAGGEEAPGPQADVDQRHQCRDLDEGPDHSGQSLAAGDSEDADGNGDGEFEVVARCGERHRGRPLVVKAERTSKHHGTAPHDGEVDEQRERDPGHVEGLASDGVALESEQDDDREQQPVERSGADLGQERGFVPLTTLGLLTEGAGQETSGERDAQEDAVSY